MLYYPHDMAVTRRNLLSIAWSAFLLLLFLAGCSNRSPRTQGPVRVVATIAPVAAWARAVGGTRVNVIQLVPPHHDPRTYTFTAADRAQISTADLVLMNGQGMEPWLENLLTGKNFRQAIIVDVTDWIGPPDTQVQSQPLPLPSNPDQNSDPAVLPQSGDPQFQLPLAHSPYQWLDPSLAHKAVTLIAQNLTRADPKGLHLYSQAAAAYNAELDNLDGELQRAIDQLPQRQFEDPHGFMQPFHDHFKWNNKPAPPFAIGIHSPTPTLVDALNPGPTGQATLQLQHGKGLIDPLNNDNYLILMRTVMQQLRQSLQP